MKLGDGIATLATPIARSLHLPCIDPETNQLRPESVCNKRRQMLNEGRYSDAFHTFFEADKLRKTKGIKTMTFIVTKQIKVEAETPEEAFAKITEGETIAISVNARPPQPPVK